MRHLPSETPQMTDPLLTIVICTYSQPNMLHVWWSAIEEFDDWIVDNVKFIVIDDCGDPPVKDPELLIGDIEIYRVTDQIPWNQMGARNLGMQQASGWCVMLDVDMVLTASMIRKMIKWVEDKEKNETTLFGICRKLKDGTLGPVNLSTPNAWLLHRDTFFDVGGYDEDFAGNKGWSDVQLMHVIQALTKFHHTATLWAEWYHDDLVDDALVMSLDRSVRVNRGKHLAKMDEFKKLGAKKWVEKKKANIRFRWIQVR